MKMRWFSMAFLVAMAVGAVSAHAADKTVLPGGAYDWRGFYVGGNLGYGWSPSTGDLNAYSPGYSTPAATGGLPSNLGTKASGALGGAQLGYNWQFGTLLLGAEAAIQVSGISKTSTVSYPGGGGINPSTSTGKETLDWLGTVRLRGGVLVTPRALIYATGGFAYGGVRDSATNVFSPSYTGNFSGSNSQTKLGWTVGAGVQWALTNRWSVQAEYRYVDLGSTTVHILDPVHFPNDYANYNFKHRYNIGIVGLDYKF